MKELTTKIKQLKDSKMDRLEVAQEKIE